MVWTQKSATILSLAVPVLALSVPLLEVTLSVMRRFLRRQPVFGADRGHMHHRLLDLGLTPWKAVLTLYLTALIAAGFVFLLAAPQASRFRSLAVAGVAVVMWIGVRKLRYSEFYTAGRLLMRGEFQRNVEYSLRLDQLASDLAAAESEEAWWGALVDTARNLGLRRISWVGPGGMREEQFREEDAGWALKIHAGGGQIVEVDGFILEEQSVNLSELARTIERSASAKWSRPPALR
jgi:UDP-GlcNAc:undecaprenyl-phosphate GlcNAc-1-phosphate transferase